MKYFANEFAYYSSESEKDFQNFLLAQNLATLILQNDNIKYISITVNKYF